MVDRFLTVGWIHSFIAASWQPANLEAERVRLASTRRVSPRAGSPLVSFIREQYQLGIQIVLECVEWI